MNDIIAGVQIGIYEGKKSIEVLSSNMEESMECETVISYCENV